MPVQCSFPEKHQFIFERHPYKVLMGSRFGLKSWTCARAALLLGAGNIPGYTDPLRIRCARETQKSIAESVHQLLEDQIGALGLSEIYEVQKALIQGRRRRPERGCLICKGSGKIGGTGGECGCLARTEFTFGGLRHDIASIKSMEGCNILWVEEAESVSNHSWDTVLPTIRPRRPNDPTCVFEIWVSFNPQLATDPTYQRWVLNPPRGAVVVKTTYLDNPWMPEQKRIEAEDLQRSDPVAYANIWLGECRNAVEGAIYGDEIKQAEADGRICNVPYDRSRCVDTFWDLGYGDKTAIWFAQALGGWYNIIDYLEDEGETISDYIIRLQQRGYMYGTDWLPHDSIDTIVHKNLAGAGNTNMSIEQLMRAAGRKVRITPKLHISSGINAARTIFPQCRFDSRKCVDGLTALRHYQWGPPNMHGALKREPLHNDASHGADSFRGLSISIRQPKEERKAPAAPQRVRVADV